MPRVTFSPVIHFNDDPLPLERRSISDKDPKSLDVDDPPKTPHELDDEDPPKPSCSIFSACLAGFNNLFKNKMSL